MLSPGQVNMMRQVVVQVGEGDFVLCSDGLTDDDLVYVIELIPVFISAKKLLPLNLSEQKHVFKAKDIANINEHACGIHVKWPHMAIKNTLTGG